MANPYGASPESLEEWNALLDCCCDMPACLTPTIECEQRGGDFTICAHADGDCFHYRDSVDTHTASYTRYRYAIGAPAPEPHTEEETSDVVTTSTETVDAILVGTLVDGTVTTCTETCTATATGTTTWTRYFVTFSSHPAGVTTAKDSEVRLSYTVGSCAGDPVVECEICEREDLETWEEDYDPTTGYTQGASEGVTTTYDSINIQSPSHGRGGITLEAGDVVETLAVLERQILNADLRTEAESLLGAWDTGTCEAVYLAPDIETADPGSCDRDVEYKELRYRWTVPAGHTGTWFRIDWDEVFVPDARDPVSTKVFTAKSWEWNDPASKTSPWSATVAPPAGRFGTTVIANVRYKCYDGPYGSLPQFDGTFPTHEP